MCMYVCVCIYIYMLSATPARVAHVINVIARIILIRCFREYMICCVNT